MGAVNHPIEMPNWLLDKFPKRKQCNDPYPRDFPAINVIEEGERNSTFARLAGVMRQKGMGVEAIYAALSADNLARCVPPLDDAEVGRIAKSICRYAPGYGGRTRTVPLAMEVPPEQIASVDELLRQAGS